MAFAIVQDIASSWDLYRRLNEPLVDPAPDGLIVHLAGPTDEGVRVIAIWVDEAAWLRFRTAVLEPAIAALGGPSRPASVSRDLRPAQVIVGRSVIGRQANG